jgi:hypothetical protein
MKKFTLLFFLVITVTISNAQSMFSWVKSSTGTGQLAPTDVAVDASGNVYATGSFVTAADFDPGSGTQILTSAGSADIFITKRSPNGNLLWAKRIGDTRTDGGTEIGLDASGNVYVTGYFSGTVDFDPGPAAQTMTATLNRYGIFILKLDASGNYVWAKSMVGNNNATAWALAVDAAGNAYTTGDFSGTVDFDPGATIQNLTAFGRDIFISKLDANGDYVWAKSITSSNTNGNQGVSISVDVAGNVYTTGEFRGDADFDPGAGVTMLTLTGNTDAYILKLNASGDFEWAKSLGGINDELPTGITVDASGAVYTTGSFEGTVDFDPDNTGTQNLTSAGQEDIYISKLDASGNYVWATRMGNSNDDYASGLSIDAAGNVYTTGVFEGTMDVDPGGATHDLVSAGDADIFITKLTTAGSYIWSCNIGSTSYDAGFAIAVPNANDIYLLGTFDGTVDFDPGTGTQYLTSATTEDTYLLHLSPDISLPLTLLNFDAIDNSSSVQLQWQTTREQSMAGFEIERSTDGKKFEPIGSIAVNNGYNLVNNYSFTDLHPLNVKSFYRLKMKDQDGPVTYSRIIVLRREGAPRVQVFPNPAKNILYVETDAHETITVQIADATGHILYQQNKTINGNTTFAVSIQTLPAGNYYLIIKGKNTQQIRQFLKQ